MTDECFPKASRILRRADFRNVYAKGRKFQARFFTAFLLENAFGRARLGITATRKAGIAVKRNRARRLVREVFRRHKDLIPTGVDIVVNVKSLLVDADYRDFEADFLAFLCKAGKGSEVHPHSPDQGL